MTLFPVVMPVREAEERLSGNEHSDRLSRLAREALQVSADRSQVRLGQLLKDEGGSPCPVGGIYWSLSHKPQCVAAVVSKDNIGIDVEELKPRTESLFPYLASEEEWVLKDKSWDTFFRYWTAKEASLKVLGIGIGGLRKCRIVAVPNDHQIILDHGGRIFLVEQLRHNNHVVSVVKDDHQVQWVVAER
jgi:4'-phosphopantetheinyl transferase